MKGKFDKEKFRELLQKARGNRTNEEYSRVSGVSRAYISAYMNLRRDEPPSVEVIRKLSEMAANGVTFTELMVACGYYSGEAMRRYAERVATHIARQFEANERIKNDPVLAEQVRQIKYLSENYKWRVKKTIDTDDDDIRAIERAAQRMTPAQRKKALKILEITFDEVFEDEDENDD